MGRICISSFGSHSSGSRGPLGHASSPLRKMAKACIIARNSYSSGDVPVSSNSSALNMPLKKATLWCCEGLNCKYQQAERFRRRSRGGRSGRPCALLSPSTLRATTRSSRNANSTRSCGNCESQQKSNSSTGNTSRPSSNSARIRRRRPSPAHRRAPLLRLRMRHRNRRRPSRAPSTWLTSISPP